MLTVKQAAIKLNLSPIRVYQLIRQGHIKAKKYGPVFLIQQDDLKAAKWNRKPGPKR